MIEISGWPRRLCTVVSVALLGLGIWATFTTDNEIGTGALVVVGGFAGVTALLGRVPRLRVGDLELDSQLAREEGVEATLVNVAAALEANKDPDEVVEAGADASLYDPDSGWTTDERWLRHFTSVFPGRVYSIQRGVDGRHWGVLYDTLTGHPKKARRLAGDPTAMDRRRLQPWRDEDEN